jgi:hypothetical protein
MIITIGNQNIQFFVKTDGIEITLLDMPTSNKYQYNYTNDEPGQITFGRAEDCRIWFADYPGISRFHCFAWFDKDNGWMVMDGDGTD